MATFSAITGAAEGGPTIREVFAPVDGEASDAAGRLTAVDMRRVDLYPLDSRAKKTLLLLGDSPFCCVDFNTDTRAVAESCARADRTGLFNCPHTGVALAAMEKLVAKGEIRPSDRVVVISTAHGLKFVDFKVDYHEMRLAGIESKTPNPPIELPARYETVRDEMLRQIDSRFGA